VAGACTLCAHEGLWSVACGSAPGLSQGPGRALGCVVACCVAIMSGQWVAGACWLCGLRRAPGAWLLSLSQHRGSICSSSSISPSYPHNMQLLCRMMVQLSTCQARTPASTRRLSIQSQWYRYKFLVLTRAWLLCAAAPSFFAAVLLLCLQLQQQGRHLVSGYHHAGAGKRPCTLCQVPTHEGKPRLQCCRQRMLGFW
jgi:hypothetical protein